ncbi:MAG: hypothetical protein H6974_12865 [Gammaproteobacteria bacterium]|nr:hypothetical protein [Gammaproteobacteria bacterium]
MNDSNRFLLRIKEWLMMEANGSEALVSSALRAAVLITLILRLPDIITALALALQ